MEDTKPKTFVFVLMPFSSDYSDVYEVGIKQACKDAGAYCERVDEQTYDENILERVYNQISKADVVVAEMTGRSANVFYETGYAHALNKRVILLTNNADDIPFNLKHYPHIVYGGKIATLKTQLEAKIRWCMDNPKQSLSRTDINLELFINGLPLVNEPEVPIFFAGYGDYGINKCIYLRIDFHNAMSRLLRPDTFDVAIIVPDIVNKFDNTARNMQVITTLPDGRILVRVKMTDALFPDGWASTSVGLVVRTEDTENFNEKITLRLYSELGPKDFPFILKVEDK